MASQRRAVLLACGSFSPVTYMHLHLLECTRDAARERGYVVLRGLLSPVHGDYGKQGLAPAVHRLRMAHIAVGDSEWIGISEWEATRTRYSRSVEVARHVKETYGEDVTVVFVCGSDVLKAMTDKEIWTTQSIQSLLNEVVLAVIPRPGVNLEALLQDQIFDGFHDRVWNVEGIFSTMSSSTIRCVFPSSVAIVSFVNEAQGAIIQFHWTDPILVVFALCQNCSSYLNRGKSIKYLTADSVISYIAEHKLFLE